MDVLKKYLGKSEYVDEGYTVLASECKVALHSDSDMQSLFEDYPNLSSRLEEMDIQDACLVRNTLRARKMSQFLINEEGKISLSKLNLALDSLKENLIPIGPGREDDVPRQAHIVSVLQNLLDKPSLRQIIENISLPMGGVRVLELVRDTLRLKDSERISSAHLRQAVLCAALTYLRQNVGSCFATAPAILVQSEQLEQFFLDMRSLTEKGSLQRVIRGTEYSVPISFNWGSGDWEKPFIVSETSALHLHPGLSLALEQSGILKSKSSKGRLREAKKCFDFVVQSNRGQARVIMTSSTTLISKVLAHHFNLSSDEIDEAEALEKTLWEKRSPFDQVQSGKNQKAYLSYTDALDKAKKAFVTLTECPLLKCWEYSLASFAEAQDDFAKWNLYTSLGLDSNTPQGIADCVAARLQGILEVLNRDLAVFKEEYDQVAMHVDYQRARVKRARTEEDAKWLKTEYKRLSGKLQLVESDYRKTERKAHRVSNLLPQLLNHYLRLFPYYFQEVYDPDMRDISSNNLYDDSPAGFRLLFKFGRSQTDQWKLIYSAEQYISSLSEFFVLTEQELTRSDDFEGLEDEISQLVTLIVQHIKTDIFLEGALRRMGHAHQQGVGKNPLAHMKSLDKKPWSYVSGGSMGHMIQCYYSLEGVPRQREKKILGEIELLTFYIDSMKTAGENLSMSLYKNPQKKILAFSPTHAFLYTPGQSLFEKAWNTKAYTYTYIRDEFLYPRKQFTISWLDRNAINWVLKQLGKNAPSGVMDQWIEAFRRMPDNLTAFDFRERFAALPHSQEGAYLGYSVSHLDALLYQSLPFTPTNKLMKTLKPVLECVCEYFNIPTGNIIEKLDQWASKSPYSHSWDSYTLQSLVKLLIAQELKRSFAKENIHLIVYKAFQDNKLAVLEPMLVADTNWTKYYFGFVVNPGTAQLEMWRMNALGNKGFPMPSWKEYLQGDAQSIWGIYCRPQEYMRD